MTTQFTTNAQAASARRVNNMKQIVLEHRQALDAFDEAKSAQASCARKGTCKDENYCQTCPIRLEKERCETVLKEKSNALNQVNERIVARNDEEALQMRIDRLSDRNKKTIVKPIIIEAEELPKHKPKAIVKLTSTKKECTASMATEVANQSPTTQFQRDDLTLERYLHHRENEKKKDSEILEMYNIPRGSFTSIKAKLLAQVDETPSVEAKATENDVSLRQKLSKLEVEYTTIVEQQQQTQTQYDELYKQFIVANNQLTLEQKINADQKEMIRFLEDKLKNVVDTQVAVPIEQDDVDYKTLYEQTCIERDMYKDRSGNRLGTIERLEHRITEIINSNNKQLHKFRDYEESLLERLLQEIRLRHA